MLLFVYRLDIAYMRNVHGLEEYFSALINLYIILYHPKDSTKRHTSREIKNKLGIEIGEGLMRVRLCSPRIENRDDLPHINTLDARLISTSTTLSPKHLLQPPTQLLPSIPTNLHLYINPFKQANFFRS